MPVPDTYDSCSNACPTCGGSWYHFRLSQLLTPATSSPLPGIILLPSQHCWTSAAAGRACCLVTLLPCSVIARLLTLCRLWELLVRGPDASEARAAAEERRSSNAAASTSQAGGAPAERHASCDSGHHDVDGVTAAALSSILEADPSAARELLGKKLGEPPRSLETLPSLIPSEINLPEKVRPWPSHFPSRKCWEPGSTLMHATVMLCALPVSGPHRATLCGSCAAANVR